MNGTSSYSELVGRHRPDRIVSPISGNRSPSDVRRVSSLVSDQRHACGLPHAGAVRSTSADSAEHRHASAIDLASAKSITSFAVRSRAYSRPCTDARDVSASHNRETARSPMAARLHANDHSLSPSIGGRAGTHTILRPARHAVGQGRHPADNHRSVCVLRNGALSCANQNVGARARRADLRNICSLTLISRNSVARSLLSGPTMGPKFSPNARISVSETSTRSCAVIVASPLAFCISSTTLCSTEYRERAHRQARHKMGGCSGEAAFRTQFTYPRAKSASHARSIAGHGLIGGRIVSGPRSADLLTTADPDAVEGASELQRSHCPASLPPRAGLDLGVKAVPERGPNSAHRRGGPDRLKNIEILILRSLYARGASHAPTGLLRWKRKYAVNLWRRGLLRIFNEQLPEIGCARAPLYMLTVQGSYVASTLFPAPRGSSGAGEAE